MKDSKNMWKKLHSESRYRPKYPSENVVQYVFRNFERNGKTKVLDLGCGAGRHVFFMGREHICPYGVDFSDEGIQYTKEMLREYGMPEFADNMKVGTLTDIPFDDNMFDGIICNGSLYYLGYQDIQKAVKEIERVLKPEGKLMLVVRTTKDYRCNKEQCIATEEDNTYIINEKSAERCAASENGMLMHFFTRKELQILFENFADVQIDTIEETHDNGAFKDSNFVLTAIRKKEES